MEARARASTANLEKFPYAAFHYRQKRLRMLGLVGGDATEARPDLVLLDPNLPGKSGHELLEEVKTHPELRPIPITVLTSLQADETSPQGEIGAIPCLHPVSRSSAAQPFCGSVQVRYEAKPRRL